MKAVIITCSIIALGMGGMVGYNYYEYSVGVTEGDNPLNITPLMDDAELFLEGVEDEEMPEWYNDSDYVDSVVIPMQEDFYDINIADDYTDSLSKYLICTDSHSCGLYESLYDKSNEARNIQIRLIEINTKLDSMEKNY